MKVTLTDIERFRQKLLEPISSTDEGVNVETTLDYMRSGIGCERRPISKEALAVLAYKENRDTLFGNDDLIRLDWLMIQIHDGTLLSGPIVQEYGDVMIFSIGSSLSEFALAGHEKFDFSPKQLEFLLKVMQKAIDRSRDVSLEFSQTAFSSDALEDMAIGTFIDALEHELLPDRKSKEEPTHDIEVLRSSIADLYPNVTGSILVFALEQAENVCNYCKSINYYGGTIIDRLEIEVTDQRLKGLRHDFRDKMASFLKECNDFKITADGYQNASDFFKEVSEFAHEERIPQLVAFDLLSELKELSDGWVPIENNPRFDI